MATISADRAREILDRVRGVRVLVVGDLMLDRYVRGAVTRISPEAPVPVVRVTGEAYAVGGAGNVAANVVALGGSCAVVGTVGNDEAGAQLTEELERQGVDVHGVVTTAGRPTTVKTRVMARHQQVVRFDLEHDHELATESEEAVAAAIGRLVFDCDSVAVEDYDKGVLAPAVVDSALGRDGSHELPTVVDPKRRRFFAYDGASVFKPNARELHDALGEAVRPDDPEWMDGIRRRLGCGTLLLTLGEDGVAAVSAEGEYTRVPAVARSVYDVSGAGDTVTAVVAAVTAAGASVVEATVLANHAAAVEVGKAGVATVAPDEIVEQCEAFASHR